MTNFTGNLPSSFDSICCDAIIKLTQSSKNAYQPDSLPYVGSPLVSLAC